MLLSVLIPARNEIYLQKTIENVLENIEGDTEIIAVCDGYWPDPPIKDHPRVKLIHHTEPMGQRQSINEAAKIARGKFIMKLDAHCAVDKGFDVKLAADCEYDWTVIPRMYNLDIKTWQPKLHKKTDYMYIGWNDKNELRSLYYSGREWLRQHRGKEHLPIDDTMGCMGPGWFMHKDRFWELGGCDENHGSWGQQGIEVACKAWLSGGALKVNKKTWFAHWFRASEGSFPYDIRQKDIDIARNYSKSLWLENKWDKQTRKFDWLLEKFNPPGWEDYLNKNMDDKTREINTLMYRHIHTQKRHPHWRGVPILKMPSDLILYHQVLWETKPDFVVEIGTKWGGTSLFLQDTLDGIRKGKVITIDVLDQVTNHPGMIRRDPRITYLLGDSTSPGIIAKVKELTQHGTVMVILDGNHSRRKVKWELHYYSPIVTPGQYLVLEDCYSKEGHLYGPGEARDWFLSKTKQFEQTNLDRQFLVGFNVGGWLRKKTDGNNDNLLHQQQAG